MNVVVKKNLYNISMQPLCQPRLVQCQAADIKENDTENAMSFFLGIKTFFLYIYLELYKP